MADADDKPTPSPAPDETTIAYWQAEAKKAFDAREKTKKELAELKGNVLSKEDRELFQLLKTEHEQIEEKKKRAEGQFDTLKTELVTKHQAELDGLAKHNAELKSFI